MPKKITQNVNKDKLFNDLPEVHPTKSRWKTKHSNYQDCNLGEIVPIYYDEVLPGEKRQITMGMISHTTTPVAPIFNSLYTEIRCFVVPLRLCSDLLNGYKDRKSPWVKVFGEDNVSADAKVIVSLSEQKLPNLSEAFISDAKAYNESSGFTNVFDSLDISGEDIGEMNFLSLAAYELIYQRHYRNENFESATESPLYQFLFNAYNRSAHESTGLSDTFRFEIANREKDYFTGIKPFTLKSNEPIQVSVGGEAKLKAGTESGGTYMVGADISISGVAGVVDSTTMVADLSTAKGISIEELRILIKTQELLEKDAIYGSLYAESLNAHFGTCPLDLTLQDPQELYKTTITSQMQAIFQTSTTKDEASILGTIGANSTTQTDPFVILPETEFKEHCILMICAVHKLQNVYSSSFFKPKFNFKHERFDFYTPELNDLGYQPVTNKEANYMRSPVIGFNEAFAEYRYKFNKCHGTLNEEFPYWAPSIGDEYTSASALYKEDAIILDKALSVRSTKAPQFYDAWGFEEINEKPMSLHSIPGFDGVI